MTESPYPKARAGKNAKGLDRSGGMSLASWLESRSRYQALTDFLAAKMVPRHRHSFWYIMGGLAGFFFVVQIVTGILLLFYYSPTPEAAHESVQLIMTRVRHGWLIRSIHSWSANLMVATVFIHMASTFFLKAYRKPRELMWITGVILLFIVLGFAFTGYLLPWDTTAYYATQIGTEIPRSIPVIGPSLVSVLRGGEFVAAESLKRLFALHVAVLPLAATLLILLHLILNQIHGSSSPIRALARDSGIPFYPNYVYRDLIVWTLGLLAVFWLALLLPVHLGPKADPLASAPPGIRPEWYFLTLYETLRLLPPAVFGIDSEVLANLGVMLFTIVLFLVPFLDRRAAREEPGILFALAGMAIVFYAGIAVCLAYLT